MSSESGGAKWAVVSLRGVPSSAARIIESEGMAAADCRVCLESHLLRSGDFGSAWIALSPESLVVVEESRNGDAPGPEEPAYAHARTLEIDTLTGARTLPIAGGGVLMVDVEGVPEEVARFEAGDVATFGALAKRLNDVVGGPDPNSDGSPAEKSDPESDPDSEPLDFAELLARWREVFCTTCGRQLPRHTQVCPVCLERKNTMLRVLSFVGPYRNKLIGMMGLMVLGTLLQLIPPQIVRILLDDILPAPEHPGLLLAVGVLASVMIAQTLVTIARARLAVGVGSHITNSIRVRAFQHLQSLSLSYFNKQQTGALMSRINNDTRQMQGFLIDGIQYSIVNILLVIGILGAMIWMNPFLGMLVILPMPLVVLLSTFVWKRVFRKFHVLWHAASRVSAHLNDALMGVRVIKVFGRETAEEERYRERADYHRDRLIDAEASWMTLIPLLNLIVQSSLLLVWYFGAFEVWGGDLTVGSLVAYVSYLGLIYGPLQLLTRLNDWLSRSLTAAARVFEILDTRPLITEANEPVRLAGIGRGASGAATGAASGAEIGVGNGGRVAGRIELRDVTFGYEPTDPVIRGMSLKVEPGEMIGIVGRSGAGKSTLINLIGRLYDVDEGAILLDGVDLKDLSITDLRDSIGYVLQETFLFNGSVADNIAYARPDASRADVIRAAVTANAHSFVMRLQDGYDTAVGERGVELSGGERQRIAIARAILHDPRILILDEATSSVDTETESKIQAALRELVKGRTTLAIAHRLSTLRYADRLVVLADGELAEQGTHEELMKIEDGVYRKLVEVQTEWSSTIAVGG
jgi:ATP-binding cassette, subfamily B, bacterial